jgi:CRISPR-associated protein Cmr2
MQAAMKDIPKEAFIFPAEQKVEAVPDIPNKYVALFTGQEAALQAAKQSRENIKKHWEEICRVVWKKIIANHGDGQAISIWTRQTSFDTLFEVYWAITEEGKQEYKDWLDETEQLFAARKRLRDFKPQNESGEKSATSGDREILHGSSIDSKSINAFWQKIASSHSAKDLDQEGKEHLDAIDTIKRFAMQAKLLSSEQPFPSTSSIATASFIESLLGRNFDPQILNQWSNATIDKLADQDPRSIPLLLQKAQSLGLSKWEWLLQRDGDLYFPSIFTPRPLEKSYNIKEPSEVATVIGEGQKALRNLLATTSALGITRPSPYYAIVQMDGDRMGVLLSGVKGEDEHRSISAALSCFARRTVPPIVEKQYPGRLIYAGGDDVLAFAPLARDTAESGQPKHVLELVDRLQSRYSEMVRGSLPLPQNKERLQGITASTGIAIAHHYTSLSYALRSAREAEDAAKKQYGRNALVVTVLRRSGEQTQVGCHWCYPNLAEDAQPIPLFSSFLTLFKEDILSPKCVHILLEEASILVGLDSSAQKSEIKRVLLRQLSEGKKNTEREERLKQLAGYVVDLAKAMDDQVSDGASLEVELHADSRRYGLVETLGWLLVMVFLARKDQDQE